MSKRLSFEESCRVLKEQGLIEGDAPLRVPEVMPRHDDPEIVGVSFFRMMVADAKLDNLTLPRTFFGRSEVRATSFRNSELLESRANWNDFIEVDFSNADLSNSDLRGCLFDAVKFRNANLSGVDFRYCGFRGCDFTGAEMAGVSMTQKAGAALMLSDEQRGVIDWQAEEGEEPEG